MVTGAHQSGHIGIHRFDGATQNAEVANVLLEDVVQHGVKPDRGRLLAGEGPKSTSQRIDPAMEEDDAVEWSGELANACDT
jgi:hypothetical protein